MQYINYFSATVISAFGLLIGVLLVRIAPEEQKPLSKYFSYLRLIFLVLIFAFPAFYYFNNAFYLIVLIIFLAIISFIELKFKSLHLKCAWSYSFFAILLFMGRKNLNLFAITSALAMLYGITSASMIYSRKEQNYYKAFLGGILHFAVANILYFTTSLF